jgi:hypothetical protein
MSPDNISDTRLPWHEVIMHSHVVWAAPSEPEPSTLPATQPKITEEDWVIEAICEYYND